MTDSWDDDVAAVTEALEKNPPELHPLPALKKAKPPVPGHENCTHRNTQNAVVRCRQRRKRKGGEL
ncbi:hypothetical protein GCM10009535_59010 [Streptomyces thermocarboxydovorans]|uniref:Uncharacterized protein n=1 Tax=Streptomyces thermocarboxydovorans TaxID=59298 RepID=A0ABP3T2H6_9ACTN